MQRPTLSICIPTWNRAKLLAVSLEYMLPQFAEVSNDDVELFISDNASPDGTPDVVKKYADAGLPITYNRNAENIGPDRNFMLCMQKACGKYIWLLGDDDYMQPGALKLLVNTLKGSDYGLLHLYTFGNKKETPSVCKDNIEFLKQVSYYSTFMSGNIFNRDALLSINPEIYLNSYLIQMPVFLEAALSHEENVLVGFDLILQPAADGANNGGYNFFTVFVENYLTLWKEALVRHEKKNDLYNYIKKHIFVKFDIIYIMKLLIVKDCVTGLLPAGSRAKGWYNDDGWRILFKHYGNELYFYSAVAKPYIRHKIGTFLRKIHFIN